jgi:HSP20 family molecular chaperone IbpA
MPAVDIFEDPHELTVQAEMPGVTKDTLKVQADRNSLLIEGDVALGLLAGMSALYADLQTTKYRRTFVLSGELETEIVAATFKDGRARDRPDLTFKRGTVGSGSAKNGFRRER